MFQLGSPHTELVVSLHHILTDRNPILLQGLAWLNIMRVLYVHAHK